MDQVMEKNNFKWGSIDNQGKKVKEQNTFQNLFKDGNWGHGINRNLGLFGFRGTIDENAQIGKIMGKMKVGR